MLLMQYETCSGVSWELIEKHISYVLNVARDRPYHAFANMCFDGLWRLCLGNFPKLNSVVWEPCCWPCNDSPMGQSPSLKASGVS